MTSDSVSSTEKIALYYHRLIETFKHGFAKRSELGDIDYVDISAVSLLLSKAYSICSDNLTISSDWYLVELLKFCFFFK